MRWAGIVAPSLGFCSFACAAEPTPADGISFFESKIRPVLAEHCYECHSAGATELGGKLLLDSRDGVLIGGESGPALIAGDPEGSLIVQALRRVDDLEMPPDDPLPQSVAHDFVEWVKMGAPDPRAESLSGPTGGEANSRDDESLWSFQPVMKPEIPGVRDVGWPRDPLDFFVLAHIESAEQAPTLDASPAKLVRRLHYDLIGLPADVEEVDAFVAEYASEGQGAVARLVDRLLASPQFGERWGRHWLDVARFGESNGNDGLGRNPTFPHAWRYRDYVIRAFNDDVPYDRFLTEQIAGDLLPAGTAEQRNRQLVATGFLAIGAKPAAAMNENFAMDVVDDQINVVSTGVMGLSVSCARCHDHKHDPIPTRDYYAMAGIFSSTETLWGRGGNEALTAPPTPLHQLRLTLDGPGNTESGAAAPRFAEGYGAAIAGLKPVLHARLDGGAEGFVFEKGVSVSSDGFAALKDARIRADVPVPADAYSVAFWFRNDLGNASRPITAYLFSHAVDGDQKQVGDHLGIGGTHDPNLTGKLFIWGGQGGAEGKGGATVIGEGTWNHVVMVRDGTRMRLYLNGVPEPEIDMEMPLLAAENRKVFVGARNDDFAPMEGRLAELVLFDRALGTDEAALLHSASGQEVRHPIVPDWAMGVRDREKVEDCKINIDGNSKKLGPVVPRGFVTACKLSSDLPVPDPSQSGRLQLAGWLTRPDHPQTARVMVNRIWLHLFGQAIVATPDDFGVYGARPTQPELLDHLATRFVEDGWSIKRMIRAIVLSRTYQLGSDCTSPDLVRADPDNLLMCRHERRRLDAESLRDSILQSSGRLDLEPASGSVIGGLDALINWPPGEASHLHQASDHRSIYLCMLRNSPPPELAAFNFPSGVGVAGLRDVTILPTQALFLLNSPFVVGQVRALAQDIMSAESGAGDEARVRMAYRRVLKREPGEQEIGRALEHVRAVEMELEESVPEMAVRQVNAWASLCQVLLASNEFRYID